MNPFGLRPARELIPAAADGPALPLITWRCEYLQRLPRALLEGLRVAHLLLRPDARALLRACDRRRASGRRDNAVIMTMLRLGLRAEEVASLTLADIDR